MATNPSYTKFNWQYGLLSDLSDTKNQTKLYSHREHYRQDFLSIDSTYYGFVNDGVVSIGTISGKHHVLTRGMYFSCPEPFWICGGETIIIEKIKHKGMFTIGGEIEAKGRLKYIDGCTDSCLIQPVKLGDPCLNALYFPPHIDQTQHTHPSIRVGLIHKGFGLCKTPFGDIELKEKDLFIIHEETETIEFQGVKALGGLHSFQTFSEEMIVIAYHPDSDFGTTDEVHPMINKTIVDGVSASKIKSIQTK